MADWVLRAFARSKKPQFALAGTIVAPGQMRLEAAEPVSTAQVVCARCNNGWMSRIDNAAAQVLRPLVQGQTAVDLVAGAQQAVAGWIFKSALTFDALQTGNAGPLGWVARRLCGESPRAAGLHDLPRSRSADSV